MTETSPIITIEEHYWDPDLDEFMVGPAAARGASVSRRLQDFEGERLRLMDEAGLQMQVLSLTAPSLQNTPRREAAALARRTNDRLATIVARRPDRFQAFAALPTPDPEAAVLELERCTTGLGFRGAMVAGLTHGTFLDDPIFRPLLATAARLGTPLYIHPSWPDERVVRTWFGPYAERFPLTVRGVWGFTLETATQALRLILSGVLDELPGLSIILGHMGEGLPFLNWRINNTLRAEQPLGRSFKQVFTEQFYVTTSGFFSSSALRCVIDEISIERVLFSVDYPYASIEAAVAWLKDIGLQGEDRSKFLGGNAIRLLRLAVP